MSRAEGSSGPERWHVDEGSIPQPRREYTAGELHVREVDRDDPLGEVRRWIEDAVAAAVPEPTAMTLATVDAAGVPDARIMLLRGIDEHGVWWFSNRASVKAQQLADRPLAAVVLFWPQLERQIRLRGRVEHLPDELSDRYFAARPRASQLASWASSRQSDVTPSRAALDAMHAEAARRFADTAVVPRPPYWGGELLRPDTVELWQGRPARLHDRLRWTRVVDGWRLERLQP